MATRPKSKVGLRDNRTKGRQPDQARTHENRGMYTSLLVKGFRSFDSLELNELVLQREVVNKRSER